VQIKNNKTTLKLFTEFALWSKDEDKRILAENDVAILSLDEIKNCFE
jgi:hypothetical protein